MPAPSPTLPKIACFHGGGSNASIHKIQCARIQALLREQFEFVFFDAPFVTEVSGTWISIIFQRERDHETELKNEKDVYMYGLVRWVSMMEHIIVIGEKTEWTIPCSHFHQISFLLRNGSYQSRWPANILPSDQVQMYSLHSRTTLLGGFGSNPWTNRPPLAVLILPVQQWTPKRKKPRQA